MNYEVPVIAQRTGMSCWAASMAMVMSWRDQASYDPESLPRNFVGADYMPAYINGGLDPNDKKMLQSNGFELDAPMCYTPQAIKHLLRSRGPLWVASWAPGPHIRVVTGMVGDTVYINDPAPVNVGSFYRRSFSSFFGDMEELGRRELKEKAPVYVAFLA